MPQSLANVQLHLIFSTKNRMPLIDPNVADDLYRYLAGICRGCHCPAHTIGGTVDHVHIACSLSRTVAIAGLLEEVKKSSSRWIKTRIPEVAAFSWQAGYGAFSIGQSQLANLKRYNENQPEHHRKTTFQEEFREFLKRYEIEYDERYVWD